MAVITKQLALQIVKKLQAEMNSRPGRPHDLAVVSHEGKAVACFDIRRGSKKELGHDHIPSQLFLSPRQTRLLGECPLSREEWLKTMAEKGKL